MTPGWVKKAARSVGVSRRPSGKATVLFAATIVLPVVTGAALAAAVLASPWYLLVAVVSGGLWLWVEARRRKRRGRTMQRLAATPPGGTTSKGSEPKRAKKAEEVGPPEPLGDFAASLISAAGPDNPLVTVIVPLHNKQLYVADCLHSLLEQSFRHWTCVIVDDGSTDNSLDAARELADRDPRFQILIAPTAAGASEARNAGLAVTTTPYVTFLDADDALLPDSILARVCALTDDPLQAGTYSEWASFADGADWRDRELEPASANAIKDYITMGWDSPCIVTAPLLRMDVVNACGGFDASIVAGEDMDFFGRLLRSGYFLNCSGTRDVLYRSVPGSLLLANTHVHWDAVVEIARWRDAPWAPPAGAPMPFIEPLSDYRRDADLMDRALANLAIALAAGCTDDELRWWQDEFAKFPIELRNRATIASLARRRSWAGFARASGGERPNKRQVRELTEAMVSVVRWGLPDRVSPPVVANQSPAPRVPALPAYSPRPSVDLRPLSDVDTSTPLVLVKADARYHVYETGPLVLELRRRGVNAQPFMQKATYSDLRQLVDWSRYVDVVYTGTDDDLAATDVAGAVVLNDWSPSARAMMDATQRAGGLTFAKVEGVQDFQDADTGRERHAYRSADVILAQGINDVEALPGKEVEIVGSSRLEQIWAEPLASRRSDRVLLNVNFTYGVLTDAFRGWLDGAVDVMAQDGLEGDISAHWAQKDMPKDPRVASLVRPQPFRYLITRAGVLVSRFSTVPFEAMARGVPFVYFNPHGEKVPTFTQPNGAFEIVTDYAALGQVLRAELAFDGDYRERSSEFFLRQVDVDPQRSSAERTADVICKRLGLPG